MIKVRTKADPHTVIINLQTRYEIALISNLGWQQPQQQQQKQQQQPSYNSVVLE